MIRFEKYFKWYKIWLPKIEDYKVRTKKGKIKIKQRLINVKRTFAYFWNVELIMTNPNWKPTEEWIYNNKYKGKGMHFRHKTHSYFQRGKEKLKHDDRNTVKRVNSKDRTVHSRKNRDKRKLSRV